MGNAFLYGSINEIKRVPFLNAAIFIRDDIKEVLIQPLEK